MSKDFEFEEYEDDDFEFGEIYKNWAGHKMVYLGRERMPKFKNLPSQCCFYNFDLGCNTWPSLYDIQKWS